MTEYQWKTVSVIGFDELMNALDRADRKGYMPDAIREEWEGFNWEAQLEQAPVAVVSGYYSGQCVILPTDPARIFNSNTPLYTAPPQREPLTDAAAELRRLHSVNAQLLEALEQIIDLPEDSRIHYKVARRAIAAAKEKS